MYALLPVLVSRQAARPSS